jgi:hypothetical protein
MIPVKGKVWNVVKDSASKLTMNQVDYGSRNLIGNKLWVAVYKRVQVQVPNHVMQRLQR